MEVGPGENVHILLHLKAGTYPEHTDYAIFYNFEYVPTGWMQIIPPVDDVHEPSKRAVDCNSPHIFCPSPINSGDIVIEENWRPPASGNSYWLLAQLYRDHGGNYTEFKDTKHCAVKVTVTR
jgi:hypothetical protein